MITLENARELSTEDPVLTEHDPGLERLWQNYRVLCHIPRSSGHEAQAIQMVVDFADARSLEYQQDEAGNTLVFLPATKGLEFIPGTVFQGHLDMVCEGTPDPAVYGVTPYMLLEKGTGTPWIQGNKTNIGADNGIGVSMMLALMDERMPHGPVAFLFTNRKETGLVSARELTLKDPLSNFRFLVNLDSEEEGKATISSAGAGDSYLTYRPEYMPIGSKKTVVDISLSGLMGGHSGVVIGEGRLNAAKTMTKVLLELDRRLGTYSALISLNGGKVRNAIMHEMKATIATNKSASEINDVLGEIREDLLRFSKLDEEQKMEIHAAESENHPDRAMDYANTNTVLKLLSELPDGLLRWTPEIENLPQTSSNIGVVKTNSDSVEIHIMSRSSIDAELQSVRADIARTARSWNATIVQPEPYAGWQPVINSMINNLADETWVRVTGSPLAFVYTHGGLECGVLRARWPHLEAISVGPTIIDPHTDAEAVNVRSVNRQYRFTKELLKNITELGDEVLML